jgi:hypothetical protein
MDQVEWEKSIKEYMINRGWTCDCDNEKTLGFKFIEGNHEWIRDYNKRDRRFVQFDGNQRVNLVSTKVKD